MWLNKLIRFLVPARLLPSDNKTAESLSLGYCSILDWIENKRTFDGHTALAALNVHAAEFREDDIIVLSEEVAYSETGFSFPRWKKWLILTSVFLAQLSMNFNAAIYASATDGIREEFGVTARYAEVGQAIFLIAYAIGCEGWAPWSEELGRWWTMQLSMVFLNATQIPCALGHSLGLIFAFRALGGLSSAGGSVTIGMVADMWEPANQHFAVAFVVLSSCSGSVLGPIFGNPIANAFGWRAVFWASLVFCGITQIIHLLIVPETRSTVRLDQHAKRIRRSGASNLVYGPNEVKGSFWQRVSWKECGLIMFRPYKLLATEPIVLCCSLLSGFSDALIFSGLDSYGMVLGQWGVTSSNLGFYFLPLLGGYLIAYGIFVAWYYSEQKKKDALSKPHPPERRLLLLCWLVLLEPIGLFIYGWSSLGPEKFHIAVPTVCTIAIGIANLAIYQATVDYGVAAYGPFAASATGGNGFCRDFLAGLAALYTRPMFRKIATGTKWQYPIPSFILCGIATVLCIPVFIFYKKGEWFRKRSPYAQQLESEREIKRDLRDEAIVMSRGNTPVNSRPNSRAASLDLAPRHGGVEMKNIPDVLSRDFAV